MRLRSSSKPKHFQRNDNWRFTQILFVRSPSKLPAAIHVPRTFRPHRCRREHHLQAIRLRKPGSRSCRCAVRRLQAGFGLESPHEMIFTQIHSGRHLAHRNLPIMMGVEKSHRLLHTCIQRRGARSAPVALTVACDQTASCVIGRAFLFELVGSAGDDGVRVKQPTCDVAIMAHDITPEIDTAASPKNILCAPFEKRC